MRYLALALFLLALFARLLPGSRTIDDSYITYRYARNILAGNGLVYNPGERVLGTTTPLYTVLMVLSALPTGGVQAPFASLAWILNAFADGFTCLLLFWMGRRLGYFYAGLGAALAWAVAPFSVTFAIGGLETSLYVLLLVGMVCAHLDERHILAAFLASLALLTRPDALILIGPLAIDRLWQVIRKGAQNYRSLLYEALAFGLPTLAWLAFATAYFGTPIPHSIAAKSVAYRLSAEEGLIRLIQHYATPFLEHLTFGMSWIAVGGVIYPFLYAIGALQALRVTSRLWPFIAYPWLYFITFAAANPLIFRWYLTPPLPAYFLFILIGAEKIITSLAQTLVKRVENSAPIAISRLSDPPIAQLPNRRFAFLPDRLSALLPFFLIAFVVLAPAVLSLQEWSLHPDHGLDRPAPDMAWYKLELLYRQAAERLLEQPRSTEAPLLAAGDVGVLGFFTNFRILDTVGLNSPQSSRYFPLDPACYTITYAIPPNLILDAQPDYVVILEVYGRKCLLKDARFEGQYALLEKIPTDIYGSDGLLILKRRSP
jgi:hypothetical protein